MNTNPLISVLMPMFNAESTIRRSLDSVTNQEPNVYEVIIVDDGSSDSSHKIAQEYAEHYHNITVWTQQNSGVAAARQRLIRESKGEYIMFLDADDYLEQNAIKTVSDSISKYQNESDIYIFGYNLVRSFGIKSVPHRKLREGIHSKNDIAKLHIFGIHDIYYSVLWNKCYKASLCKSPEIIFEKHIEDVLFNLEYFGRCSKIAVCEKVIYNYVQIGESLTRSKHSEQKPTDNTNAIRGNVETYKTMMTKAVAAYPNEQTALSEYIYMQLVRLKKQNSSADIKSVAEFNEMFNLLKKQLGLRTMSVSLKATVFQSKQKIKAIIKNILSKIKKQDIY